MKNKNKFLMLSTLFLLVFSSVVPAFALFYKSDSNQSFTINVASTEEKYYASINGGDKVELTKSNDIYTYTYGGDLLLDYGEDIIIYNSSNESVGNFTSSVDGIYNSTFTFNPVNSELSVTLYKTKIYLSDLNKKGISGRTTFWSSFYVYVFGGTSNEDDTEWPGDMLTEYQVGSKTLYVSEGYYFLDNMITFNNGLAGNDLIQTSDLSFDSSKPVYRFVSNKCGNWSNITGCNTAVSDSVNNYEVFLKGEMNNWSSNSKYGFEKSNNGSQYMFKVDLATSDEFKFYKTNGNAWYGYDRLENNSLFNGAGSSNITAKSAGTYIFYFKSSGYVWAEKV